MLSFFLRRMREAHYWGSYWSSRGLLEVAFDSTISREHSDVNLYRDETFFASSVIHGQRDFQQALMSADEVITIELSSPCTENFVLGRRECRNKAYCN